MLTVMVQVPCALRLETDISSFPELATKRGQKKGSVSYYNNPVAKRGQFHIIIIPLTWVWILDGIGTWQGSLDWNMRGRYIT